jgi:hypothetical protein
MADQPFITPASPTPTVFNTPQQATRGADDTPPPVTQVAGASLRLTFQTPMSMLPSSTASSTEGTEYYKEAIAAAGTAAAATIDGYSLRLPSYLLRLAGRNDLGVNLSNVLEEADSGNGGDSNVEDSDAHEHDVALNAFLIDRMSLLEETNAVEDADDNCVVLASGINADPQKAFHSKVETFSNLCTIQIGLGGSYGHRCKKIVLDDLVQFDGFVIHDDVKGGSNGAIHRQWMNG